MLRMAKCESRRDPRGLETHSGPRTGLLMASDVAVWRVRCLQARGRGRASSERDESSGREPASHQRMSLPDLWLMIDGLAALCGARRGAISASSVPWLELDVWLTSSLLRLPPRDAWRNFSIENTVPRASSCAVARVISTAA